MTRTLGVGKFHGVVKKPTHDLGSHDLQQVGPDRLEDDVAEMSIVHFRRGGTHVAYTTETQAPNSVAARQQRVPDVA